MSFPAQSLGFSRNSLSINGLRRNRLFRKILKSFQNLSPGYHRSAGQIESVKVAVARTRVNHTVDYHGRRVHRACSGEIATVSEGANTC